MSMKRRGTGHDDPPPGAHDNKTEETRGQDHLRVTRIRHQQRAVGMLQHAR